MPMLPLSAQAVQAATCITGKAKTDFYDTSVIGFILTVSASGSKVYSLRYRDKYGKQRQLKIGDTRSISFDRARQAAQKARSNVVLGGSPADDRAALRKVPTVGLLPVPLTPT